MASGENSFLQRMARLEELRTRTGFKYDALTDAFEEAEAERAAAEQKVFRQPPGDPQIAAWNRRFVGGFVRERTFYEIWEDHDKAGLDWFRQKRIDALKRGRNGNG